MTRGDETAEGPLVLRQSSAVFVPVVVWVFCAFVVVDALAEGGSSLDRVRMVLLMASIAFLAWMFLFSPCLAIDRAGVRVVNPLRVHVMPFEVIDDVEVRGLTAFVVHTRSGRRRRITSWNAPGVPRAYSATTPPVAEAVELRRGSWERSGRRDPTADLRTSWRWRPLVALLLVLAVQVTIWRQ